ncbi:hypothetical protein ACHAPT_007964 [Fusarium lateritium]
MPPKTRSGGVPAPSRVYHSTPAQQQAHFPARRKIVRTYGKQNRKKQAETSARSLRQQTLTQFDFVSSFEEHDPIELSDSEDEEEDEHGDEERESPDVGQKEQRNDEDEEPVSSGRKRRGTSKKASTKKQGTTRRRTLGDNDDDDDDDDNLEKEHKAAKTKRSNWRKTTGDAPSSSYHTQTLTQFLGRDGQVQYIKDSEDEEEDDGFHQWLGDPTSPSPRRVQRLKSVTPIKRKRPQSASKSQQQQPEEPNATREESVVPQTPRKRAKSAEIPSSSQLSAPPSVSSMASLMMDRYGAPDQVDVTPVKGKGSSPAVTSPLKEFTGKPRVATTPRRRERIIQDSYATESWGSVTRTPLRELPVDSPNKTPKGIIEPLESSSALSEMETPTKPRRRGESTELGGSHRRDRTGSPTPRMKLVSPGGQRKRKVLLEIPDSEDEDDENFGEDDENVGGDDENDENTFIAGAETQFVMNEIASSEEPFSKTPTPADPSGSGSGIQRKALGEVSTGESSGSRLRSSTSSSPPLPPLSSRPTTLPPPSATLEPSRRPTKRLRKPIHRPLPPTQTQPLESQRVPLPTLQSLPPASARTDVLLPLPQDMLEDVIEGFRVALLLPFKIPAQVVRFWLYDGELLRFLACAEPGRVTEGPAWRYHLTQVYELNNPVEGDDMREEGWVEGDIGRYIYIPPAVVGQLLWNLRHAIFDENDAGEGAASQTPAEDESGRVNLFANSSQAPARDKNPPPTPSMSVSQQVEAQLKSDIAHSTQFPTSDDILVPSTPEEESNTDKQDATPPTHVPSSPTTIKPPPRPRTPFTASSYRASRPPLSNTVKPSTVRPSQATTVSQASTPEKNSSASLHRPALHSSSSIGFPEGLLDDEDGPSSPPLRLPADYAPGSSQLLTKSQMLPDSLVRDDARVPPEIWDSDDDDERL